MDNMQISEIDDSITRIFSSLARIYQNNVQNDESFEQTRETNLYIRCDIIESTHETIIQSIQQCPGVVKTSVMTNSDSIIDSRINASATNGMRILRYMQDMGYPKISTAIVYIGGPDFKHTVNEIQDIFVKVPEIVAIEPSAYKNHVFMIHFNYGTCLSSHIVKKIRDIGHKVIQVGC